MNVNIYHDHWLKTILCEYHFINLKKTLKKSIYIKIWSNKKILKILEKYNLYGSQQILALKSINPWMKILKKKLYFIIILDYKSLWIQQCTHNKKRDGGKSEKLLHKFK